MNRAPPLRCIRAIPRHRRGTWSHWETPRPSGQPARGAWLVLSSVNFLSTFKASSCDKKRYINCINYYLQVIQSNAKCNDPLLTPDGYVTVFIWMPFTFCYQIVFETDFTLCINSLHSMVTEQSIYTSVLLPSTLKIHGYTCTPYIFMHLQPTPI